MMTSTALTREEIERRLSEALEANAGVLEDSQEFAAKSSIPHQLLEGVLRSLAANDGPIAIESFKKETWELTPDGESVLRNGTPEYLLLSRLPAPPAGIPKSSLDRDAAAFPEAMKLKWVSYDRATDLIVRQADPAQVVDVPRGQLAEIKKGRVPDAREAETLKKRRKWLAFVSVTSHRVRMIRPLNSEKLPTNLTAEMLQGDTWRSQGFRALNLDSLGAPQADGHLHPLSKMRQQVRQIFLEMGFEEMPTDNYVESSFWNFDSLFQPQQHPARDMHDTFFMADPRLAQKEDVEVGYRERVKEMHEKGGDGSIGWRYCWSEEESRKNILRTHTTGASARMLYALARQPGGFKPVKCFSIDRVFRNETLDVTHLAEFHQIEGFIADYNIGLPHLIGTLRTFFGKLGMRDLKLKPAFNPYTEPSMELYAFHPGLNRTIEVGNSGVFRPEMLRPMGLPEDVQVIAWGLSLERPTMIMNGIGTIRSLFGPESSLEFSRTGVVCALDR